MKALLQRKLLAGGAITPYLIPPGKKPPACEKDAKAPGIVNEVIRSSGQPLDAATRSFMEPRFGHDFSWIRIHTDGRAASSAKAVNALAYTVGRDIVFGPGQFAPGSEAGRRLLAHELTHTLQQRSQCHGSNSPESFSIEAPNATPEIEADRMASSVLSSSGLSVRPTINGSALALARNLAPNVTGEVDTPLKETLATEKKKTQTYQWHAKYSVYLYDHNIVVEVRIKLKGKVSEKIKKEWLAGINHKWNDKYRFANDKRKVNLSFRAVFTDVNPQVVVNVVNKPKTSGDWDRSTWDAGDGEGDTQGDAASHEFGHMIGNKDEYNLPDGKGGKKSLDGVMNDAHAEAKERHFTQFRDWLNAHRAKNEGAFNLEKIK